MILHHHLHRRSEENDDVPDSNLEFTEYEASVLKTTL